MIVCMKGAIIIIGFKYSRDMIIIDKLIRKVSENFKIRLEQLLFIDRINKYKAISRTHIHI